MIELYDERSKVKKEDGILMWCKLVGTDQATDTYLDFIEEIALENPDEFDVLVDYFEGLKETNLEEISNKLLISEVLVNLKYEPVTDFFFRIVTDPRSDSRSDGPHRTWTTRSNKIWAAVNLVSMNDDRGLRYLEEVTASVDGVSLRSVVYGLYDHDEPHRSTTMGLKLLLKLADQYEKVENIIDRPAVEKQLEKFLEPNPFKRLWKKLAEKLDF